MTAVGYPPTEFVSVTTANPAMLTPILGFCRRMNTENDVTVDDLVRFVHTGGSIIVGLADKHLVAVGLIPPKPDPDTAPIFVVAADDHYRTLTLRRCRTELASPTPP